MYFSQIVMRLSNYFISNSSLKRSNEVMRLALMMAGGKRVCEVNPKRRPPANFGIELQKKREKRLHLGGV